MKKRIKRNILKLVNSTYLEDLNKKINNSIYFNNFDMKNMKKIKTKKSSSDYIPMKIKKITEKDLFGILINFYYINIL
jgi:hypothetical protein